MCHVGYLNDKPIWIDLDYLMDEKYRPCDYSIFFNLEINGTDDFTSFE